MHSESPQTVSYTPPQLFPTPQTHTLPHFDSTTLSLPSMHPTDSRPRREQMPGAFPQEPVQPAELARIAQDSWDTGQTISFPARISIRPILPLYHAQASKGEVSASLPIATSPKVMPSSQKREPGFKDKAQLHGVESRALNSSRHHRNVSKAQPAQSSRSAAKRLVTDKAKYDILRPLGSGRSGNNRSYLIESRGRQLFVEKRMQMTTRVQKERAAAERDALWQLQQVETSKNVPVLIEAFYDGVSDHSSLILEYCDSGSLDDYIYGCSQEKMATPEGFAWHVLDSLARALCLCHFGIRDPQISMRPTPGWNPVCHCAIKPSNVLLTVINQRDRYPRVVLSNFSCVADVRGLDPEAHALLLEECGGTSWLPPEASKPCSSPRLYVGEAADIWQVGGVVQALCRLMDRRSLVPVEEKRPCGSRYSPELNVVVTRSMARDPRHRPTAPELVANIFKTMKSRS